MAHLVDVAVGEGQRAKDGEAGARQTWAGETTWRLSAVLWGDLPYPGPSADTHLALGRGWGTGAQDRAGGAWPKSAAVGI